MGFLAYLAFSVAVLGVQDAIAGPLQLSDTFQRQVLIVLLFGIPLVLVLAWYHGDKGRQRVSGLELLLIALIIGGGGLSLSLVPSEESLAVVPGIDGKASPSPCSRSR